MFYHSAERTPIQCMHIGTSYYFFVFRFGGDMRDKKKTGGLQKVYEFITLLGFQSGGQPPTHKSKSNYFACGPYEAKMMQSCKE